MQPVTSGAAGLEAIAPVSILIQPEGRMQLTIFIPLRCRVASQFQSSSSQKAGCNFGTSLQEAGGVPVPRSGFNPHPARRPDATAVTRANGVIGSSKSAGFNPHPARRAGCNP